MSKPVYFVLDTEFNYSEKPYLVTEMAFAVVNDEKVIHFQSFNIIPETEKILVPGMDFIHLSTAVRILLETMQDYHVNHLYGYNVCADIRAIISHLTSAGIANAKDAFNHIYLCDIMSACCRSLFNDDYILECRFHGYFTKTGKISCTMESAIRVLMNHHSYMQSHTASIDTADCVLLLWKLLREVPDEMLDFTPIAFPFYMVYNREKTLSKE